MPKLSTSEVMLRLAEHATRQITGQESTAISTVKTELRSELDASDRVDKMVITCIPSTDTRARGANRKQLIRELTQFIKTFPKGTSDGYRKAWEEDWTETCEPEGKSKNRVRAWQNDQGLVMIAGGPADNPKHKAITEFWYEPYEVPISELMLQMAEDAAKEIAGKDSTAISVERTNHAGVVAEHTDRDKITVTCVPRTDNRTSATDRDTLRHELATFIETFPNGSSNGYRMASKEDWTESHEPEGKHTSRIRGWHNAEGIFMTANGSTTDPKHEVKTEYWYQELPADDEASEVET